MPWIKTKRKSRTEVVESSGDMYAGVQMGMGLYIRHCAEFMLFGVRGKAPTQRNDALGVIFAPRGRHSAKPTQAYELIESLSPAPRLELFGRAPRAGYDVWGDEAHESSERLKTTDMFV